MQDKLTYKYAVIRLVPKVEREEFFNIGVILFCKRSKFLDIRFQIDELKLKAFTSEVDLQLITEYLAAWKLVCEGSKNAGKIGQLDLSDRFGWLTATRSTMIQSSITHTGLTLDPEKALDVLFEEYVL